MHHLPTKSSFHSCLALLAVVFVLGAASVTPAQAACQKTPAQIAATLPKTSDPILHLQNMDKALAECGDTETFALLVDRTALAIPFSAKGIEELQGTWVSDIWLTVERGQSFAMADILTVSGSRMDQAMMTWMDPAEGQKPDHTPQYLMAMGQATLAINDRGRVEVGSFEPTPNDSGYSPYFPPHAADAMQLKHQMVSFNLSNLSRIVTIKVSGDQLLLVDTGGNVRSYARYKPGEVYGAHAFILAANIPAHRHWPCILRVVGGRTGGKQIQDRLRTAAKIALDAKELQAATREASRSARDGQSKAETTRQLDRLLQSEAFRSAAEKFQTDERPAFCGNSK